MIRRTPPAWAAAATFVAAVRSAASKRSPPMECTRYTIVSTPSMAAGSVEGSSTSPCTTVVEDAIRGERYSGWRARQRTGRAAPSNLRRSRPPMYPVAPVSRTVPLIAASLRQTRRARAASPARDPRWEADRSDQARSPRLPDPLRRRFPGAVDPLGGQAGQFRDPTANIITERVEPFTLGHRVEHTEIGSRVGPHARRPLPAAVVRSRVAIHQMTAKPALPFPPVDQEILHQKRCGDHTCAVVHPAGREQLAHAGVHYGETGLPPSPRLQARIVAAPTNDRNAGLNSSRKTRGKWKSTER